MWVGLVLVGVATSSCGSDSDGATPSSGGASGNGASGGSSGVGGAGGVQQGTEVTTGAGVVVGTVENGVRVFRGIPYAEPPLGELRFKAPQPHAAWSAPFDATRTPNKCPQLATIGGQYEGDEDCLTLNVWTPSPAPASPRPTLVWIHGGAFTGGSGAEPQYQGDELVASSDVVVVTLNYRVGPLGFLVHPALNQEQKNLGLLDQRLALTWVRDNVAAFGGDPENVTIFGESAGGVSVCAQLTSDGSKGLFQRAISQSGPCSAALPSLMDASQQGVELAEAVGCTDVASAAACLRQKNAEELIKALPLKAGVIFGMGASWGPILDGEVLSAPPAAVVEQTGVSVPVIFGANANEGDLFVALAGLTNIDETAYNTIAATFATALGIPTQVLLAQYPASSYPKPADALSDAIGDSAFVCPARRVVREVVARGGTAYLYHFSRGIPLLGTPKAIHGAEIPFVFGQPLGSFTPNSSEDMALSRAIMGYWTRFAATADPNGQGVAWPQYDAAQDQHLGLDSPIAVGSGLHKDKCDFWDQTL